MDLKSSGASDPSKSISHHDRQIAKSILAQFLELGADGGGGSYALSEDQSSLFTLGLTAIANQFCEVVNKELIEELVYYNFDLKANQTLPKLDFAKIGDVDYEKLTTAIDTVVSGGIVGVDDNLEDHVRDLMDLPDRTDDSTRSTNAAKQEEKKEKKAIDKTVKKAKSKSKEEFSEQVLQFSEDTKIEARVANRIIKHLEKRAEEKELGISDIGVVLNNLKSHLRQQVNIAKLLNKVTDEDINGVIDDIVRRRTEDYIEYPVEHEVALSKFSEEELKKY